jgi:EAL domain-containing protein (putative c-di-GMP-specific phosphodiesterase class I)
MTGKKKIGKGRTSKKKVHDDSDSAYMPVYHEVFEQIKQFFITTTNIGLILIDCSKISVIEKDYGKKAYGEILQKLKQIIFGMRGSNIRKDDIITVNHAEGDQFYIFLSKNRNPESAFQISTFESLSRRIFRHINNSMFTVIYPLLKRRPKIIVGYSFGVHNPLIKEERLVNKLIDDARTMADYQDFMNDMRDKEKLQEIIVREEISTIYQPIVNMDTREILGYEGLSRGPKGTDFENPYVLFNIAEDAGLLFELDRVCRKKTFKNAKGIEDGKLLFVNILPTTIHDPEFKGKYLREYIDDVKISPRCVVLEISERQAIENHDIFVMASNYYSDLGFAIAIDDAGTGYSSLERITQLRLQFVKIDMTLIREIQNNKLKRELVKAIIQISKNIGARVIAEGIESNDEMLILMELGVVYGQGYFFARPDAPFPGISIIQI